MSNLELELVSGALGVEALTKLKQSLGSIATLTIHLPPKQDKPYNQCVKLICEIATTSKTLKCIKIGHTFPPHKDQARRILKSLSSSQSIDKFVFENNYCTAYGYGVLMCDENQVSASGIEKSYLFEAIFEEVIPNFRHRPSHLSISNLECAIDPFLKNVRKWTWIKSMGLHVNKIVGRWTDFTRAISNGDINLDSLVISSFPNKVSEDGISELILACGKRGGMDLTISGMSMTGNCFPLVMQRCEELQIHLAFGTLGLTSDYINWNEMIGVVDCVEKGILSLRRLQTSTEDRINAANTPTLHYMLQAADQHDFMVEVHFIKRYHPVSRAGDDYSYYTYGSFDPVSTETIINAITERTASRTLFPIRFISAEHEGLDKAQAEHKVMVNEKFKVYLLVKFQHKIEQQGKYNNIFLTLSQMIA
jgi:hypothetical protein